jgi:sugar lactone lactonase YvrE
VADSYLGIAAGSTATPQLLHAVPGVGTRVIPIAPELVPTGVAFDSEGRLLVATFGWPGSGGAELGQLLRIDPATGEATDLLPGFDFSDSSPIAVAVSADDQIYISVLFDVEPATTSIFRVDSEKQTADPIADGLRSSGLPYIAVDPDGWLVTAVEIAEIPTLIRIDPDGVAENETILAGAPLSSPTGIAVDAAGTIFVANSSFGSFTVAPLEVIEITDAGARILPTQMGTNGVFGLALEPDGDLILSRLPPREESFMLASELWRYDRIDERFERVMAPGTPAGSVTSAMAVVSSHEAYAIGVSLFEDGIGEFETFVGIIELNPSSGSVIPFYESLDFIGSIFDPELAGDLAIDGAGRLVAAIPSSGLFYVDRSTGDTSEIVTQEPIEAEGIVVEPVGSYLVVALGSNDRGRLERVDPETGGVTLVLSPIVEAPLSIANPAGLALDPDGGLLVPVYDESILEDDQGRVVRVVLPEGSTAQAQTSTADTLIDATPSVTEHPLAHPAAVAVGASGEIFIADRGASSFGTSGLPGQVVRVDLAGIGAAFGPELVAPADVAVVPEPGPGVMRGAALLALSMLGARRRSWRTARV